MSHEMRWLETHIGTMEDGIALINKLCWNLTINDQFVMAGDQVIFQADSREAIDGFIYGMALAYSVLPEDIFQTLKKRFEESE